MHDAATRSSSLAEAVRQFEKDLLIFSHTDPDWNADPALYPHLMELKNSIDLLRHTLWFHIKRLPQPLQEKVFSRAGTQSFLERIDDMITPQLAPASDKDKAA